MMLGLFWKRIYHDLKIDPKMDLQENQINQRGELSEEGSFALARRASLKPR